jgi:hypothetical protein
MTPGTKSGGGAEKDKHSAENDKKVPKMTKSKCRKKVPKQVATSLSWKARRFCHNGVFP